MTPTEAHHPSPGTDPDVVVVGAGLAGLAAATVAARAGADVRLIDAHEVGGRARSEERSGYVFNRGAHALYRGGAAERVLTDLGVDGTCGAQPPTAGAQGWRDGRLHLLPQGPGSLLRTTVLRAREKPAFGLAFARLTKADPAAWVGRPVTELVTAIAGSPERAAGAPGDLVRALVRLTTYCHAPETMDAGAALANVQAGLDPGVTYLDGGWQTLVDGVLTAATSAGVAVTGDIPVRAITPAGEGGREAAVHLGDGTVLHPAAVVLAAGTPAAAIELLGGRPAGWGDLGPPATAACLDLGLRRVPEIRVVLGLDRPWYLSTHAPPARLAPDGSALVCLLAYQAPDDDRPATAHRDELEALAGAADIDEADIAERRFLARMTVTGAMPTAAAGGLAGRPPVASGDHPGVFLAGDWVGPEGLLADAALASAASAGSGAVAHAQRTAAAATEPRGGEHPGAPAGTIDRR